MITLLPSHRADVEKTIDTLFARRIDKLLSTNLSILPKNCIDKLVPLLEVIFASNNKGKSELTLIERRNVLSNILLTHRYAGTVYAVEEVLTALFESAEIIEYKGHFFEVLVHHNESKEISEAFELKAIELINSVKNARSHLRGLKIAPQIRTAEVYIISAARFSIQGVIDNWKNL